MNVAANLGYKQTELGLIPDSWDYGPLEQFWNILDCKHVTAEFFGSGYPLVSIREVQERFVDLSSPKFTSAHYYSLLTEGGRKPLPGDLILSRNATVGEVAQVAEWHPPFAMGQDVCLLRRKNPACSTGYLQSLFQSSIIQNQINNAMVGSTFKRMNVEQIRGLIIPFPPVFEQTKIADSLQEMDVLISGLDQLIAKKRDIQKAAMQQLLTGQRRLPGFSGEREVKPFNHVLKRINAKAHQVQTSDYQASGKYPIVDQGKDSIVGFSDNEEKRFRNTDEGVIVFGDHTCIVKFVDFDFLIGADGTQVLHGMEGQSTRFHAFQLQYRGVEPTGYNRHFKFLKERSFQAPLLDEQNAVAAVLSDMDSELAALETRRDKAHQLKQGMMQELLTGRIRLA
ncbi:MAG: restriction endonuclease subunit S [Pseudomonas sp.]|uniref:restriction endonuclease subunit S n=1 Tax=Pseudomonas sp. TaxID=306 RepID=UPI00299EF745|nr:restriction endonuclease subunit S [Pseudomonas sp.]MDX1722252.1 restriction endonuclease subunit S [Pseudomonas sp.]